jgi:hypothetical protein
MKLTVNGQEQVFEGVDLDILGNQDKETSTPERKF